MEERSASRTAVMVAGYRARATAASEPICRDPWARELAGEEGERLSRELDRVQRDMEIWVAVRTRIIDDRLRHAVGPRCRISQVVLGAGLDELALDYTGTYDRDRKWRFQYFAEASVAPPEIASEPEAA